MTKRDETASDHLHKQAAATPQDELVAGLSGQPESIHTQALLAQVLERANLRRASRIGAMGTAFSSPQLRIPSATLGPSGRACGN